MHVAGGNAESAGIVDLHRDVQTCGYHDVPGDVGHAGPGDRRGAHRAGAPPEAGAAVLDAVVLALAAVASRARGGAVSCARGGVAPFGFGT